MEYGLGPHILLDFYGCPKERLADVDFIFDLLTTFPAKIGINQSNQPQVFKYHGRVPDEWGVTGVMVVDGTHFSVHTFPDKQHAFIDIFSNQEFDTQVAYNSLVALFQAERHELQNISRTPEFLQMERREMVGAARIIN